MHFYQIKTSESDRHRLILPAASASVAAILDKRMVVRMLDQTKATNPSAPGSRRPGQASIRRACRPEFRVCTLQSSSACMHVLVKGGESRSTSACLHIAFLVDAHFGNDRLGLPRFKWVPRKRRMDHSGRVEAWSGAGLLFLLEQWRQWHVFCKSNAGGFNDGARRTGFGPFEQRRPGFTLSRHPKGQIPGYSAAWPVRGLHVQASCQRLGLRRSALRLLCPLLTSALRSDRLTTFLVSNPRHSADLPR